jgi:hypothetical protein
MGTKPHSWCNYSHLQGDDAPAWSLPYFPPHDTTQGMDADCVQWGTDPCPRSAMLNGTMGEQMSEAPCSACQRSAVVLPPAAPQ